MRRTGVIVAFLILLAAAAAGQTYTVDYTGDQPEQTVTVDFEGLDEDTAYSLVRIVDGNEKEIQDFTSNSGGFASVTFNADPFGNDVDLNKTNGWHYRLIKGISNTEIEVYLFYSHAHLGMDSFSDDNINYGLWQITTGGSSINENNGALKLNGDNICISRPIVTQSSAFGKSDKAFFVNWTTNGFNNIDVNFHNNDPDCGGGFNAQIDDYITGGSSGTRNHEYLYYNESADQYQIWRKGGGLRDFSAETDPGEKVYVEIVDTGGGAQFFNFGVVPRQFRDKFSDPRTFKPAGSLLEYDGLQEKADGNTGLKFEGKDGGQKITLENVPVTTFLTTDNTQNGTLEILTYDFTDASGLTALAPDDGKTFIAGVTTDNSITFTGNFDVPDPSPDDANLFGTMRIEVKEPGASDFKNLSNSDVDYTHEDGSESQFFTDQDQGTTFDAEVLYDDLSGTGTYEWRFAYQINGCCIIRSDTRNFELVGGDKAVQLLSPVEGTTLTTSDLTFSFDAFSEVAANVILAIDGDSQKTWSENDEFNKQFQEVITGISDGDHTYQVNISGDDGDVESSETRNFSVDSMFTDVTITLTSPADAVSREDTDVTFNYTVDSNETGRTLLYLNGDVEVNSTQPAASKMFQPESENLKPGQYTWTVVFSNDNRVVQGATRTFTITQNVSITPINPEDEAIIDTSPVIFTSNVSTNVRGVLELVLNGEVASDTQVNEDFKGTASVIITDGFVGDKNKYRWRFTPIQGDVVETGGRIFYIQSFDDSENVTGVQKDVREFLAFKQFNQDERVVIGIVGILAVLILTTLGLCVLPSLISMSLTGEPSGCVISGGILGFVTIIAFLAAIHLGLFPSWVALGIAVLSAVAVFLIILRG